MEFENQANSFLFLQVIVVKLLAEERFRVIAVQFWLKTGLKSSWSGLFSSWSICCWKRESPHGPALDGRRVSSAPLHPQPPDGSTGSVRYGRPAADKHRGEYNDRRFCITRNWCPSSRRAVPTARLYQTIGQVPVRPRGLACPAAGESRAG